MAVLMITPDARGMHWWINDTYGIGDSVKEWCQQLADKALPAKDGNFDFASLLDVAEQMVRDPSVIDPVKAGRVAWSVLESVRSTLRILRQQGVEALTDTGIFECDVGGHKVLVEVLTIYHVKADTDQVAFVFFESCKPESTEKSDPHKPEAW